MTLRTKIKKSLFILSHQGLKPLLQAIWLYLKRSNASIETMNEIHLIFDCLIKHFSSGVMVDVGAHYGGSLEIFADAGWQIYAFEPDNYNRAFLTATLGDRDNIDIDKRGLSDQTSNNVNFYTSTISTGISGLSAFHESHQISQKITITTLKDALIEKNIKQVHFLKIDTEGFDFAVLKGLDWSTIQPELIICEFEDRKSVPLGYTFHDLAKYLKSMDYYLLVSEWYPIVHYGSQHRWRSFKPYPCELADSKAWGNIIAVKNESIFNDLLVIADHYQLKQVTS